MGLRPGLIKGDYNGLHCGADCPLTPSPAPPPPPRPEGGRTVLRAGDSNKVKQTNKHVVTHGAADRHTVIQTCLASGAGGGEGEEWMP